MTDVSRRRSRPEAPFPLSGQPVRVQLDGRNLFVWWGEDRRGNDCLATRDGRLEVANSETGIRDAAASHGWAATGETAQDEHVADGDQDAVVVDVDEIRYWLSHTGRAVPVTSALNVWNLATDVAYSLGLARADREYWSDRAYSKLFAANVPRAVGLASYWPRWTREELKALRRIEGDVVALLRTTLTGV